MPKYFKKVKGEIVLDVPHAEFYIPMNFFNEKAAKSFAEDRGSFIHTVGIFNVAFFDESGKLLEMKLLNLPTKLDVNVYNREVRNVVLPNDETVKCLVLKYVKGQAVMKSAVVADSANAEE